MKHTVSRDRQKAIKLTADRLGMKFDLDEKSIVRDFITYERRHGDKINLSKLETFDDFNAAHDVYGIRRANMEPGSKHDQFFLPRCGFITETK